MDRPIARQATALGRLILRAMANKGADMGEPLNYRALGTMTGVNFTHIARIVRGERQPSRDIIEALARGLRPYLNTDEALMAAGFLPGDEAKASRLRELGALPLRALEAAVLWARQYDTSDQVAKSDPKQQRHGEQCAQS